jgi:ubiquinone/menaquinone biosynthesis C-methylase UbiE
MSSQDSFIPALSYDALTPFYDRLLAVSMREQEFKRALIGQINLQPGDHILDLGCGTATLLLMLKNTEPTAEVIGLDADEKVLAIARRKIESAGLDIQLDQGMAYQLPYAESSLDHVTSSLVTHHLTLENKQRAFQEVYRVLRPGGTFHIADFGRPRHLWARLINPIMRDFEETRENFAGRLPDLLIEAGFIEVSETKHYGTMFGTLTLYAAKKAA